MRLTFGKRIRLILELKNIPQKEFAWMIHTSESQVSKLLNDKKKPTVKELSMIVERLGIPYECIVGEVEFFDYLLDRRSLWR